MIRDAIKTLLGIGKTPQPTFEEVDYSNELHYHNKKLKVLYEARRFKYEHKDMLERRLKKGIDFISLSDLINAGFMSINLTRKHLEEISKEVYEV